MPKLYSARNILKALSKAGFVVISQKGSHIKLRGIRNGKIQTVIVPNHKQIAFGTFRSILNQSGMLQQEFENFI